MKNKLKKALLICFVVFAGLLHSCSMGGDTDENVIEILQSDSDRNTEDTAENDSLQTEEAHIYVFITGCVNSPGVYELPEGTRLYELVELAGGFTEDAAQSYLNLAAVVKDGDKITVYSEEEITDTSISSSVGSNEESGGKRIVNINTADKETLMTLPGIGEAKAGAILQYREENGGFLSIDDIMNISGIKQGAFDKIKDLITI